MVETQLDISSRKEFRQEFAHKLQNNILQIDIAGVLMLCYTKHKFDEDALCTKLEKFPEATFKRFPNGKFVRTWPTLKEFLKSDEYGLIGQAATYDVLKEPTIAKLTKRHILVMLLLFVFVFLFCVEVLSLRDSLAAGQSNQY